MGNIFSERIDKLAQSGAQSAKNCNIYTTIRHESNGSFLGVSGYEGIPQNFIINLFSWVVLNLLFIVLRKKAWNYGRMAVMQKEELKWTDMLYGDDASVGSGGSSGLRLQTSRQNPETTVTIIDSPLASASDSDGEARIPSIPAAEGANDIDDGNNNGISHAGITPASGLGSNSAPKEGNMSEIKDSGYFSWIKIMFTLTDKQYQDKCGPDCVSYLSFQRHLIFLALIITCCSLMIVLPINMHPNRKDDAEGFSKTTIINLSANQLLVNSITPNGTATKPQKGEPTYVNFLWTHVVLSIVYLFISIAVMRHYSKGLQLLEEDSTDVSHTICIIGLRKDKCREDILRAHLLETYPGTEILEVSFAYNISKLQHLEFQRLSAASAKRYFEHQFESEKQKNGESFNKRPTLRPYRCGVMGCCFKSRFCCKCQCKETDAIDYYTEDEQKFAKQVAEERQKSLNTPLGIAFVTFSTIEAAERIVEDYACSARVLLHTPESKYTKDLNSNHWIVKFAPVPEDIYWENLTLDFKMWYVKFIGINFLLLIIVVIFSTPVYLFTLLIGPKTDLQKDTEEADKQLPIFASAIVDTLPTGLVWVLGIILISLVYQSDALIGFWTKTAGNLSEMIKIFFFLTFMVIILPALGITSISYIWNSPLSWSCIFFKENGALFVNYVCTSSLTGTAAELMRLPELFVYAVKLCFARSVAEVGAIRKSVLWDFQIGSNYAWMMLHFAIFTCFSVIYPLVTPFGLLYLVLKHLVDRYNIYFAYAPCKVEKEVHATAVNFVIMSMFMLQINLLAYVHFYIGRKEGQDSEYQGLRALQVFSLLGFSVTAALFLGQVCFNVCADFSPIHHFKNMITDQDQVLEVGRASAVQPQPHKKHGSRSSRGSQTHGKRNTKDKNEVARSSVQVVSGGEIRIIPVSDVPAPVLAGETPSSVTDGGQETQETERSSVIVSSNYTGSGKPYGRYIPPLLRPEFVRLLLASQNQQSQYEEQTQLDENISSRPSDSSRTSQGTVQVVSEKKKKKRKPK